MAGVRQGLAAGCAIVGLVLASGCQLLPGNPFGAAPTPTPLPGAPPPKPTAAATPEALTSIWVKNHRVTEMWSGPSGEPNVISFGVTSEQFCSFRVVRPPDGDRLYVYNPYSDNYFWIDASAVGPVPNPPERRPGPKPPDENCAEAIYEG